MLARRHFLLLTTGLVGGYKPVSFSLPESYKPVWSDGFTSFSLRTGGPTDLGLQEGKGVWAAPGTWWARDPKGVQGYAYDWLVNPSYHWPDAYKGPFAITSEGLRIRSQFAPPIVTAILPKINLAATAPDGHNVTPWLSAQINSWYSVRIAPPFYFECRAKMPRGVGRPWPAIWLMSGDRGQSHRERGQEYEIDLHEGFGDSDNLHCTVHWNPSPDTPEYLAKGTEPLPMPDLSADFNTWGCHVTTEEQTFYFNGKEVWRFSTPSKAKADQQYSIILDVTAGIPWKGGGPPSDGPHDMIVRYVKLYAPDNRKLFLSV